MLKKLISGAIAGAVLLCGTMALACSCGEGYRTYEYINHGTRHSVAYYCSNPHCEDPFTVCGYEDCTYPDDTPMDEPEVCIYCLNGTNFI